MNDSSPNTALQRTAALAFSYRSAALSSTGSVTACAPATKPGTCRAFASRRSAHTRAPGLRSLSFWSLGDFTMRALMVTAFALGTVAITAAQEPPKATSRVKTDGDHFIIPEAKASFTIPKWWLTCSHHFRLDSTQLNTLQQEAATREWDSAYGPIADAILPFGDCLFYIGAWSDVQMRAYLTNTKPAEISKTVAVKGVETAAKVKGYSIKSDSKDEDGWRMDHVGFDLTYWDYGGRAGVYFYSRPYGSKTLVLVFMLQEYERAIKDRDGILNSFRMEK